MCDRNWPVKRIAPIIFLEQIWGPQNPGAWDGAWGDHLTCLILTPPLLLTTLLVEIDICVHWLFCRKFNSEQFLFEAFFNIICIFCRIEPLPIIRILFSNNCFGLLTLPYSCFLTIPVRLLCSGNLQPKLN